MPCGKCALMRNLNDEHDNHMCYECKNNKEVSTMKTPYICLLCVYPNCYYDKMQKM